MHILGDTVTVLVVAYARPKLVTMSEVSALAGVLIVDGQSLRYCEWKNITCRYLEGCTRSVLVH